jgi:hypothetical protein
MEPVVKAILWAVFALVIVLILRVTLHYFFRSWVKYLDIVVFKQVHGLGTDIEMQPPQGVNRGVHPGLGSGPNTSGGFPAWVPSGRRSAHGAEPSHLDDEVDQRTASSRRAEQATGSPATSPHITLSEFVASSNSSLYADPPPVSAEARRSVSRGPPGPDAIEPVPAARDETPNFVSKQPSEANPSELVTGTRYEDTIPGHPPIIGLRPLGW